jgi:hypothetical protein
MQLSTYYRTYEVFSIVFTNLFLVTDSNNVLYLRPYWLMNMPQLTYCSNCVTSSLAAISHQPSTLLFTNAIN